MIKEESVQVTGRRKGLLPERDRMDAFGEYGTGNDEGYMGYMDLGIYALVSLGAKVQPQRAVIIGIWMEK